MGRTQQLHGHPTGPLPVLAPQEKWRGATSTRLRLGSASQKWRRKTPSASRRCEQGCVHSEAPRPLRADAALYPPQQTLPGANQGTETNSQCSPAEDGKENGKVQTERGKKLKIKKMTDAAAKGAPRAHGAAAPSTGGHRDVPSCPQIPQNTVTQGLSPPGGTGPSLPQPPGTLPGHPPPWSWCLLTPSVPIPQ